MAETVRAFFAIAPGGEVRDALVRLAGGLAQRTRGRASRPESIHMTLAFVGEVDESQLDALKAIGAALPDEGFDVVLDATGGFSRPQVAWVAPSLIPAALSNLQRRLADELAAGGFRVEARAFAPHLTVARKCEQVPERQAITPIPWRVDAFALWGSALGSGGARYRELAVWRLRPVAAPDVDAEPSFG